MHTPTNPIGGCTGVQEKLQDWNGLPRTTCCQKALLVFAHALALKADTNPEGNTFLGHEEWDSCSGPFKLQNVSAQACGFHAFLLIASASKEQ